MGIEMSTGTMMVYGGLIGSVFFLVLFFSLQRIFRKKRKKIIQKLNGELE